MAPVLHNTEVRENKDYYIIRFLFVLIDQLDNIIIVNGICFTLICLVDYISYKNILGAFFNGIKRQGEQTVGLVVNDMHNGYSATRSLNLRATTSATITLRHQVNKSLMPIVSSAPFNTGMQ